MLKPQKALITQLQATQTLSGEFTQTTHSDVGELLQKRRVRWC